MNVVSTKREVDPSQLSISTLLVAILGIASFLAFPLGMARSSPAWSVPVSFLCWSIALLLPAAIVAPLGRLRPSERVAHVSLTACFWNVVAWLPVPAYRVMALVVAPLAILLATVIVGRFALSEESERQVSRRDSWSRILRACAWNSLSALALFLAIAYALNVYGYVVSRPSATP